MKLGREGIESVSHVQINDDDGIWECRVLVFLKPPQK